MDTSLALHEWNACRYRNKKPLKIRQTTESEG